MHHKENSCEVGTPIIIEPSIAIGHGASSPKLLLAGVSLGVDHVPEPGD